MSVDFTHLVRLWIDNEEPLYNEATNKASDLAEEFDLDGHKYWSREEFVKFKLADHLQELCENLCEVPAGMASDLMQGALAEVDWNNVAEAYCENLPEPPEEEEEEAESE